MKEERQLRLLNQLYAETLKCFRSNDIMVMGEKGINIKADMHRTLLNSMILIYSVFNQSIEIEPPEVVIMANVTVEELVYVKNTVFKSFLANKKNDIPNVMFEYIIR